MEQVVRTERSALQRLCLCLLLLVGFTLPTSAAFDLVILHTNDVHARIEETSESSGTCRTNSSECFAGVARRATMIKRIRSTESNVLLLDAGDQFQGTPWFSFFKGTEAAHFMSKLGYDAMAFGNHEFDLGPESLVENFLERINFTVVSANTKTDTTLASTLGSSYSPSKVFTVGGERVAVVGYITTDTAVISNSGPHLQFEDEVTALQVQVDQLLTSGVNKIIALGHAGFPKDQEIARRVRGVDLVIGGHTDTFLFTGTPPSTEVPAGVYPFMVSSDDGRQVPVVQAYTFGKYLGNLKMTFDNAGNMLRSTGNPILLSGSIPQDPEVLADVTEWKKNLTRFSAQVVGETLVFLNGTREECRFRECNMGNVICDAMVANNIRSADSLRCNHVGAGFYNAGGIRDSIDERARNGSIIREDMLKVLPFGNTVDLVQLNGSTLFKAFEHSVRRYGESTGEFLQVSGFRVEFDPSRPSGNRVTSLQTLCTRCRVPRYEPVQNETVYTVVMPSFIANGGDRFSMISNEKLTHVTGNLDMSVLSNYITQRSKVIQPIEGRIQISNSVSGHAAPLVLLVSLGLLWTLCGNM
ncbi:snake venom 5'-nucleotidase-like [Sebastes fasciatus]|uniref:snake venom 5'-nucleotidase-like n=1 Tax=Sebastes fasciatus TaxID=394691 RepID=UPI003D9E1D9E